MMTRLTPRYSALVRATHWINSLSFFALVISGGAILIAHPRLYWGETGGVGSPSFIDLPIPFMLGHSGWGRYLHFLAAWICVGNGSLYVLAGLVRGRFGRAFRSYGKLQRLAYLIVVFALFPCMIVTGLAMSPAIVAVFPVLTIVLPQQSARTVHFFAAAALVVFFVVHVMMVTLSGLANSGRPMITGHADAADVTAVKERV